MIVTSPGVGIDQRDAGPVGAGDRLSREFGYLAEHFVDAGERPATIPANPLSPAFRSSSSASS